MYKPVRRRVKSKVRLTGIISNDGPQGNWFESQVERAFYICTRADPNVLAVVSQPVEIHFEVDGKARTHTPDALVTYRPEVVKQGTTEHILYELKHFKDLIKAVQDYKSGEDPKKLEDIWIKAAAAGAFAEKQGWLYRLITDRRLGHYIYNAAFLSYFQDMPLDHELAASILANVDEWPGIRPQLLMQRRPREQRLPALATVWTLLYQARLYADLSRRISNLVQIYPAGRPLYPRPVW